MEKLLLPLLLARENNGQIQGRTRFQKMIFLFQESASCLPPKFEYFAWDYGPYSRELQEYIDALVELNLLSENPVQFDHESEKKIYEYKLTPDGHAFLKANESDSRIAEIREDLCTLTNEWRGKRLDSLIKHVYDRFPDYAARSKLQF